MTRYTCLKCGLKTKAEDYMGISKDPDRAACYAMIYHDCR